MPPQFLWSSQMGSKVKIWPLKFQGTKVSNDVGELIRSLRCTKVWEKPKFSFSEIRSKIHELCTMELIIQKIAGTRLVFFVFLIKKTTAQLESFSSVQCSIENDPFETPKIQPNIFFFLQNYLQWWKYEKFWRKPRLNSRKLNQTMVKKTKTSLIFLLSGHLFLQPKMGWKW